MKESSCIVKCITAVSAAIGLRAHLATLPASLAGAKHWLAGVGRSSKCLLVVTAMLLSACDSAEDKALDYFEEAQQYFEENQPELAMVRLRNALRIDPQLVEAHFLQSRIFERNKNWRAEFASLSRTIQLDDSHLEANIKLGKMYLLSGDLEATGGQANKAIELAPESADANTLMGAWLLKTEQLEAATEHAHKALAVDNTHIDAIALYASIMLTEERYEDALESIATGLAATPDSPVLHLIKVRVEAAHDDLDAAAQTFQSLISHYPADLAYRQSLALFHMRLGQMEKAEQVLRTATKDNPEDYKAKLTLAQFLARENPEAAMEQLQEFIDNDNTAANTGNELEFALAELYKRQGTPGKASNIYQGIIQDQDSGDVSLTARNELARLALDDREQDEAKRLIAEVLAQDDKNPDALVLRAYTKITQRETDHAIADLRVVLRDQPESDNALELLGRAYLQHSAIELAQESFARALQANKFNSLAAKQLSRLYIQQREFSKAEAILAPIVSAGRADDEIQRLLIQVKMSIRDWPEAEYLASITAETTNNPEFANYVKGVSLQAQGKHSEAVTVFEGILKRAPDTAAALIALVRSYNLLDESSEAESLLKKFIKRHPDNVTARDLLAREYGLAKNWPAAEKILKDSIAYNPQWLELYRTLATTYSAQNKFQQAITTYEQGLGIRPEALAFKLQLAGLHEKLGHKDQAKKLYQELLEQIPALDVAANNLAMILSTDNDGEATGLDSALVLARRFENSEQPFFADTLGWLYVLKGNYPKAIELLERAVKKAPGMAEFHYHLGAAYFKNKNVEQAKTHLERAVQIAEATTAFNGLEEANKLLTLL